MMMIRIVMIDIAHTLSDAVGAQPGVRYVGGPGRVMPGASGGGYK